MTPFELILIVVFFFGIITLGEGYFWFIRQVWTWRRVPAWVLTIGGLALWLGSPGEYRTLVLTGCVCFLLGMWRPWPLREPREDLPNDLAT